MNVLIIVYILLVYAMHSFLDDCHAKYASCSNRNQNNQKKPQKEFFVVEAVLLGISSLLQV